MAKTPLKNGTAVEESTVNGVALFLQTAYNMASKEEEQAERKLNIPEEDIAEVKDISLLFKTLAEMAISDSGQAAELYKKLNDYQKNICTGSNILRSDGSMMSEEIKNIILSSITVDDKNQKIYVQDPTAGNLALENGSFTVPIPGE